MLPYTPGRQGPYDLVQAWREALAAGERLAYLRCRAISGRTSGTPENYLAAHRRLLQASPRLAGYFKELADPLARPRGQDRGRGAIRRRGLSGGGRGSRGGGRLEKYRGLGPGRHRTRRGVGRLHRGRRGGGERFRPGAGAGRLTLCVENRSLVSRLGLEMLDQTLFKLWLGTISAPSQAWRKEDKILEWRFFMPDNLWTARLEAAAKARGVSLTSPQTLAGDGSDRRFYRLLGSPTAVLLFHPNPPGGEVNENDSYYHIGRHLKAQGVPVPEIYTYCREESWMLLEDLGDISLEAVITRQPQESQVRHWYQHRSHLKYAQPPNLEYSESDAANRRRNVFFSPSITPSFPTLLAKPTGQVRVAKSVLQAPWQSPIRSTLVTYCIFLASSIISISRHNCCSRFSGRLHHPINHPKQINHSLFVPLTLIE